MRRYVKPNLKNTKKELLESLSYELDCVETSYWILSNAHHPVNENRTPNECQKLIDVGFLKERIAFFKCLIQVVKDFKYQEEN